MKAHLRFLLPITRRLPALLRFLINNPATRYLLDNAIIWIMELVLCCAFVYFDVNYGSSIFINAITKNFTSLWLTLFSAFIAVYALISTAVAKLCIEIAQKASEPKYWDLAEQNTDNVRLGIVEGIIAFTVLALCFLLNDIALTCSWPCTELLQLTELFCAVNIIWQLIENIKTLNLLSTALVLLNKNISSNKKESNC